MLVFSFIILLFNVMNLKFSYMEIIAWETDGRGVVICAGGRAEGATEDGILLSGMYSGGGSGCWDRGSRVPVEVQAGDICAHTGISDIGVSRWE
jgi:hypothetical protein